jgi:hypothetical protein
MKQICVTIVLFVESVNSVKIKEEQNFSGVVL